MFGRNNQMQRQSARTGFSFRGMRPPYPYIGRGKGGLPRCQYPGNMISGIPTVQELDMLKKQAEAIKEELKQIESRIQNLEVPKKE